MKVPFLDLKAHHDPILGEVEAAIHEVLLANAFAGGPFVSKFEADFAAFCGARHSIGLGNGTDALWLPLLALGVGPGDEVVTVPHTFMATAEAITYCGARPVFVDIDAATYTMDPARVEAAITPRTKAIIPVHLYGQPADMDPILAVAARHGLPVIEDACQAHGARYKGRPVGTLGQAGAFSFYPGKNLGAFGEAGATVTNDDALRKRIEMFRDHGQARKYYHDVVGWNARMDGIQGAVLRVKLKRLEWANDARRAHAALYRELLAGCPEISLPCEADYSHHVYHLFVVRVKNRDQVLQAMGDRGIGCGIHYPIPVHLQEAYRSLGYKKGDLPVSEQSAAECLSLPMFPELTEAQICATAEALKEVVALRGARLQPVA
jgi:dTDP-4-amino-4,6-dideoxygalactose transaminase